MELISTEEVAELLGLTPRALRNRTQRPDFPQPVKKKNRVNQYDKKAILTWHENDIADKTVPSTDPATGEKLITLQEAAAMLGMTYGSLRTLITRFHDMPLTPHTTHKNRPLFTSEAVRQWDEKRLRRRTAPSDITATSANGLITRQKVAEILGVKPNTVTRYSARDISTTVDFPLPVDTIGRTRLWDPKEIHAWKKKNTRKA